MAAKKVAQKKPTPKKAPRKKALPKTRRGKKSTLTRTLMNKIKPYLQSGCLERHVYQALGIPEQTWMAWRRKGRELAEMAEVGTPIQPKSQQQAKDMVLMMELYELAESGRAYSICEDVKAIGNSKHWQARAWRLAKHDPESYGKEPIDVNLRITEGPWEELHRILAGEGDEHGDGDADPSEEA